MRILMAIAHMSDITMSGVPSSGIVKGTITVLSEVKSGMCVL